MNQPYIYGYPGAYSVHPGDPFPLHICTNQSSFTVQVFPLGSSTPIYTETVSTTVGAAHPFNFPANPQGANAAEDWQWPQNYSLPGSVSDVQSGIYMIGLTAGAQEAVIGYVVRAPADSTNAILYKMSLATVVAYNDPPSMYLPARFKFDGGANGPSGYKTTMRRPISEPIWAIIDVYERPLVQFLQSRNYGVDYCIDVDIQVEGHALLDRYNLLLCSGHDEYWSQEMRTAVETFRDQGGNVAFLSGNTAYWRIHFTNNNTAFVCNKGSDANNYATGPDQWAAAVSNLKDGELEPAFGNHAAQLPTFAANSEARLTGVSTRFGGIIPDAGPDMVLGYRMQFPDHWAFQGITVDTRAATGDRAASLVKRDGQQQGLVGYEVDGTPVMLTSDSSDPLAPQVYVPARTDLSGTPDNFIVLGTSFLPGALWTKPNDKEHWQIIQNELVPFSALNAFYAGYTPANRADYLVPSAGAGAGPEIKGARYAAVMGVYSRYGIVFTASTTNWNRYLPGTGTDNVTVQSITANVLDCLKSRRHSIVGHTFGGLTTAPLLLLQHDRTDEPVFWTLKKVNTHAALERIGTGSILYNGADAVRSGWKIVGAAALNGKTYVFFQKIGSGSNIVNYWWFNAQFAAQGTGSFGEVGDPAWRVVGFPVFDPSAGDPVGTPQALLRNDSTGELLAWALDARASDGTLSIEQLVPIILTTTGANFADPTWKAVATPDVDGDGTSDILFQRVRDPNNPATPVTGEGDLLFGRMSGFQIAASGNPGSASDSLFYVLPPNPGSTDWIAVGAADLNGDGVPDILFQNQSTGEFRFWLMAFNPGSREWTMSRDVVFPINPWKG